MRFYRFELAFDGEPQDVGLFQGMDSIKLPSKTESALLKRFDTLPLPNIEDEPDPVSCWFTDVGVSTFESSLNVLIKTVARYGFEVIAGCIEEDTFDHAVYHDNFQAIWTREYLGINAASFTPIKEAIDVLALKAVA